MLLTFGNSEVPTAMHKSSKLIEDIEGEMSLIRHISTLVIEPLASFHLPRVTCQKWVQP